LNGGRKVSGTQSERGDTDTRLGVVQEKGKKETVLRRDMRKGEKCNSRDGEVRKWPCTGE